ncbi:MAG: CopG family transcriptional regulator [candidate division NC10 bacterium]|nr:CopG family transcriptional regulator [candidate division NC10 bacterium]
MRSLKRKQIYLDAESDRRLKQLALATKTSEAEHIRRAVRAYLANTGGKDEEKDPLLALIGLCDDPEGPRDASVNHDAYLYGKARRR